MPAVLCKVCNRITIHFNGNCTDHSDWPSKIKPRAINVVIPAYVPEPAKRQAPVRISMQARPAPGLNFTADSDILEQLHIKPHNFLEAIEVCSFCGCKVDDSTVTRGKGTTLLSKLTRVEQDPEHIIETTIRRKLRPVSACPDCCLKVEQVSFPKTEG